MSDGSDVDNSVTSPLAVGTEADRKILTVPGRMILNEILRQLNLPLAQYEREVHQDHRISVAITFCSSNSSVPVTMSGIKTMDESFAEHTAAVAAVRYLETHANFEVRDFNYAQLKYRQEAVQVLNYILRDLRGELKRAKAKCNRLARGWFWSVRHMSSFAAQFHNVAVISGLGGQEVIHDDMNAAFGNIYGIAKRLKSKSIRQEAKLEEVRSS